jgi:hypothetical protein
MLTTFYDTSLPYFWIGILALILWFLLSFSCAKLARKPIQATVLLNLVGFFVLIWVGIQELVFDAYWTNFVGEWTQLYYLPLLNIGFTLTRWDRTLVAAYCVGFILMVLVSLLGCKIYQKRFDAR